MKKISNLSIIAVLLFLLVILLSVLIVIEFNKNDEVNPPPLETEEVENISDVDSIVEVVDRTEEIEEDVTDDTPIVEDDYESNVAEEKKESGPQYEEYDAEDPVCGGSGRCAICGGTGKWTFNDGSMTLCNMCMGSGACSGNRRGAFHDAVFQCHGDRCDKRNGYAGRQDHRVQRHQTAG